MKQKYEIDLSINFYSTDTSPRKRVNIVHAFKVTHFTPVEDIFVNDRTKFQLGEERPWGYMSQDGKEITFVFPYVFEVERGLSYKKLKSAFSGPDFTISQNVITVKTYAQFLKILKWIDDEQGRINRNK